MTLELTDRAPAETDEEKFARLLARYRDAVNVPAYQIGTPNQKFLESVAEQQLAEFALRQRRAA